jgi:hypothetical protein
MRRCCRSSRCRAALAAPPRSSTFTVGTASTGSWSTRTAQQPAVPATPPPGCRGPASRAAPVHRHVAGVDDGPVVPGREQGQRQPARRQLVGHRAEEPGEDLVGEGEAQRLRQDHPDRARRPVRQHARGRVGPHVPELLGQGQDPLAQRLGQLVRAREGVRHRGAADAQAVGQGLQGHPATDEPPPPLDVSGDPGARAPPRGARSRGAS